MRDIILGTDWWTDCDDAVALRIICNSIKKQLINVKGIIVNACMEYSVASLDGFLTREGIQGIPIGLDRDATDFGGEPPYQRRLSVYAGNYKQNADAEDAVRLYRKILASAEGPVELVEIGYLQAVVALFKSMPDDISEKTGMQLVREKVRKIWVMAGKWDRDGEEENNFCRNERSRTAAHDFCVLAPVPVTFLGWEVGNTVITGGKLSHSDYLYQVLCDHGSDNGRSSWDPMLTLMAVIGDEGKAGYTVERGVASVDSATGANYFKKDENGPHQYVKKKYEDGYYEEQINCFIGR